MRILIYADETLDLNMEGLLTGLNAVGSPHVTFELGRQRFNVSDSFIRYPQSYKRLPKALLTEVNKAELSLSFTRIPYDNNYFFHGVENLVIVSFYSWEQLTRLPIENGVIYFLSKLLRFRLPLPDAHENVTGCVNDFLWDKTGVDSGMRSGFLCNTCAQYLEARKLNVGNRKLLDVIRRLLDDLGNASRADESIIEYWTRSKEVRTTDSDDQFAVFLCHNSKDKPDVRLIRTELEQVGIRTWFDEEQLRPGTAWQVVLEEQIVSIQSAAVFVGRSGIGPWQNVEMRAFLSEFVNRRCPVIPVILASAKDVPELPIFLRQLTWVDFRQEGQDALSRLIWGITGTRPSVLNTEKTSIRTKKRKVKGTT